LNLDALGNLGDFLGGIGVLATLLYLAHQVRQNTISARSSSYQAVVASVSEWSRAIGVDPAIARLMRVGQVDPDALDDDAYSQYEMFMISGVRNFENIHYQYLHGGLTDAVWAGWSERILGLLAQPGAQAWWRRNRQGFSPEFRDFVDGGLPTRTGESILLEPGKPRLD
jgi:hypothetical protein